MKRFWKSLPLAGPLLRRGAARLRTAQHARHLRRAARVHQALVALFQSPNPPLFYSLSLETITQCNSTCAFCAANRKNDRRGRNLMPYAIIDKACRELGSLAFSGIINLDVNDEPLLDPRIADIVARVRNAAPDATLTMWTNGTLLDWDRHRALFENGLNALHVNNYANSGRMHPNVQQFLQQYRASELARSGTSAVAVQMRRLDEVGDNRGGIAPNKRAADSFQPLQKTCHVPFAQAHLNYAGDLFLCCVDTRYRTPLGNVGEKSLVEIWRGEAYCRVRQFLGRGDRGPVQPCCTCDSESILVDARLRRLKSGHQVLVLPHVLREYRNRKLLAAYTAGSTPVRVRAAKCHSLGS